MTFTRTPGVARRSVDGRDALVDPHGVELVELDPARAAIWESLQTIADRDAVDSEVATFLVELEGIGLISDADTARRASLVGPELPEVVAHGLRDRLDTDRELWIDVTGGSMRPSVRPGDRVQVVAGDRPGWGEVWAYCHQSGIVVVHRCRGRKQQGFVFQGDAELRSSAVVPPKRLIGQVVAVGRGGASHPVGVADRWGRGLPGQVAYARHRIAKRIRRMAGREGGRPTTAGEPAP